MKGNAISRKSRQKSRFAAFVVAALAVALLAMTLGACQAPSSSTGANNDAASAGTGDNATSGNTGNEATPPAQLTPLKVGASVAPHAEILENIIPDLAAAGYDLQIIQYTDYVKPNLDTAAGDTQANYFQHQPYLDEFNKEQKTDLVSAGSIHFEPLGIYPGKTTALASLPDGGVVAVPNDPTNEARALQLLAAQGLITLPENAGWDITPKDIATNPKNLKFVEVEAAAVPRQLEEVDLGVINGNNAIAASLDIKDALATEDAQSDAAQTYANIVAVPKGHENDPGIQALVKALASDKTRQFIESKYSGAVVPVF
ncbi:MAG: MetQ/NlpA family ABC transporter substrate-binding protein [Actinomycetia bacterium]|nr:MetQ/NlpA family ABC transporter substrate-binding protein [Actinomycetes bacterium]